MGDRCKPEVEAFQKVLDDIGVKAEDCVMFEDSFRNIVTAKKLGMKTVFVAGEDAEQGLGEVQGHTHQNSDLIDCTTDCLTLPKLSGKCPFLWN